MQTLATAVSLFVAQYRQRGFVVLNASYTRSTWALRAEVKAVRRHLLR